MRQSSEHRTGSRIGRGLATAAIALLCVVALGQPRPALARGGGEGSHGGDGGGGFHGGGGGFHGGGFHGGGFHRFGGFRRNGFFGGGFYGGGFYGGGFYGGGFYGGGFYGGYPSDGYSEYDQPSSAAIWYYCADPAGYYPNVTQCYTGWQSVPAS